MGYLGENNQFLRGKLRGPAAFDVLAVPDTGAECNVIRKRWGPGFLSFLFGVVLS